MNKSLETEAESLKTNTKSTAPVKGDTATTDATAKPTALADKSETTPKAQPARTIPKASTKVKTAKAKPKTSSKVKAPAKKARLSKQQSAKDLLSNQDNDVPDLNTSTDYPIHPNRIWPD